MADVFRAPDENIFTDPGRVVVLASIRVLLTLPTAAVLWRLRRERTLTNED